jgi:hypothetical protein
MLLPHHLQNGVGASRRTVVLFILFLLAAASLWILNSVNVLPGSWANALNPSFTCIGTIVALMQLYAQISPDSTVPTVPRSPHQDQLHKLFLQRTPLKRKGMVLVYTNRHWRRNMLYLLAGLQEQEAPIEAIANVVVHRYSSRRLFLCRFPSVPPGHYTLVAPSKHRSVQLTVYAGHVSEVDWR